MIKDVPYNIAFSPDERDYVIFGYCEDCSRLYFHRHDLKSPHGNDAYLEIGHSQWDTSQSKNVHKLEPPTERSFYIDLVRVLFLTQDGRMPILDTRSMQVEGEIEIKGYEYEKRGNSFPEALINQIHLCDDHLLLVTRDGKLLFVSLAKIVRSLG